MNILYLTNHLNIGGITSYVSTLSGGMKLKGHNVYIASGGGDLKATLEAGGCVNIAVPMRTKQEISLNVIISLMKLSAAIKKCNIDIVHSNTRTTQVLGCLLQKFSVVSHVSTCHGFFKRRLSRKIFPCWGKKIIAISEQVKDHLVNDFKVKADKIYVIHNGIDVKRFREPVTDNREQRKTDLGLSDSPVVGIVARLSDVKGHIYLIEAMKNVIFQFPSAKLLIVGDGKMRQELINLTKALKIEKNILFISAVNDTKDVLSVMDIFVMPSLKEGLGLALMEAMAFGLAVIGSDIGGIKTLIQDQYNGLLVPPKDTISLSKAILELLQDGKKRKQLGENAKSFIGKNFSREKMIEQTERAYLECVEQKK